jgi:hypothetical protein
MRSARPKALNTVSTWWWVLHAAQVVDVQRHAGVVDEALEELAEQVHVETADLLARVNGTWNSRPGRPERSITTRDRASSSGT